MTLDPRRLVSAVAAAVVVNALAFAVGSAAGATWQTTSQSVDLVVVAIATVVPLLGAGVVVSAIGRRYRRTVPIAAWAGLIFGVAGIPLPFLASSDLTTSVSLATMHITAGIAWFAGLGLPSLATVRTAR